MADGFNLPDGCWEGDPRAPWNLGDGVPLDARMCSTCLHFAKSPDLADAGICGIALSYGEGRDAAQDAANAIRDAGDGPCDAYEGER